MENKTKEEILANWKQIIQGPLSGIYWTETIFKSMESYANQQLTQLSQENARLREREKKISELAFDFNNKLSTFQDRLPSELRVQWNDFLIIANKINSPT